MILITGTVVYLNELMKVPVFFIFTMIATWLAVIFLMWNHKNTQKKQKRMFMVGGIFLSVVWIALYMMQIID